MIRIKKTIVLTGTEAVAKEVIEIKAAELTSKLEKYLIEEWDGSLTKVRAAVESGIVSIVEEESGHNYVTTVEDFNSMVKKASETIREIYER